MQTKIKLQNRNEKWLTLFFNHPRYDFFVLRTKWFIMLSLKYC